VDGGHVWIDDFCNVVELADATGSLVRVVSSKADMFDDSEDILSVGNSVWVSNYSPTGGNVTELNASSGALVRVIR
jgi:hypothetical protein